LLVILKQNYSNVLDAHLTHSKLKLPQEMVCVGPAVRTLMQMQNYTYFLFLAIINIKYFSVVARRVLPLICQHRISFDNHHSTVRLLVY